MIAVGIMPTHNSERGSPLCTGCIPKHFAGVLEIFISRTMAKCSGLYAATKLRVRLSPKALNAACVERETNF